MEDIHEDVYSPTAGLSTRIGRVDFLNSTTWNNDRTGQRRGGSSDLLELDRDVSTPSCPPILHTGTCGLYCSSDFLIDLLICNEN